MSGLPPSADARASLPDGLSFWHPAVLAATWFGTGLLPKAPGTWGSLAALPIAWVIAERFGALALVAVGLAIFLVGLWAVKIYLDHSPGHSEDQDPGINNIDEVAGQLLALVPAGLDPLAFGLAFIAFRFFDVIKPWPIGALERRLDGALGVMADDLAAALYAAAIVSLFLFIKEGTNVFF